MRYVIGVGEVDTVCSVIGTILDTTDAKVLALCPDDDYVDDVEDAIIADYDSAPFEAGRIELDYAKRYQEVPDDVFIDPRTHDLAKIERIIKTTRPRTK